MKQLENLHVGDIVELTHIRDILGKTQKILGYVKQNDISWLSLNDGIPSDPPSNPKYYFWGHITKIEKLKGIL